MVKKRKKSKFSDSRKLNKCKIDLLKSANKPSAFYKTKYILPRSRYDDFNSWFKNESVFLSNGLNPIFPSSPSRLKYIVPYVVPNLIKEFQWGWSLLKQFSSELSTFRKKSEQYENSIVLNEFDHSNKLLDEIENLFGFSYWFLKNKIYLIQSTDGLEAQKRYSNDIIENTYNHGIIPFLTHYISYRVEPAITPHKYVKLIEDLLSKNKVSSDLESFFRYHLLPGYIPQTKNIPFLLVWDSFGALIDYYNTIVNMLFSYCTHNISRDFLIKIAPDKDIIASIGDKRLSVFYDVFISNNRIKNDALSVDEDAFSLYLNKDFDGAINQSLKIIETNPSNINAYDIASKSLSFSSSNKFKKTGLLYHDIIRLMKSIISKDDDYYSSTNELIKICWNNITSSWAKSILSFCYKEFSAEPFDDESGYQFYTTLHQTSLPVSRLQYISPNVTKNKYISFFKAQYTDTKLLNFFDFCSNNECSLDEIPFEEQELFKCYEKYDMGEYDAALKHADNLINTNISYYANQSIRMATNSLLELNKIEYTIDKIIESYLSNNKLISYLPILKAIQMYQESEIDLSSNINLSILYDLGVKQGYNKYDYLRAYAYEDFLLSQGYERPSELENGLDSHSKPNLIYFLKEICVENIMDNSEFFTYSDDVPEERINVCSLLLKIDIGNKHYYNKEIKDIISRLTIKKRLREIEKSKIYIDIDSIHSYAKANLKESYERYISFLQDGIENIVLNVEDKESVSNIDIERLLKLILPDNEKYSLFNSMVLDLRDQFVSSTEHGLDGYLSVRIRHGTLSSQLRSALENHHLITQKTTKDSEYSDNAVWKEKYSHYSNDFIIEMNGLLNSFSHKFDSIVDQLNNDWIQIKTQDDQEGLFDFRIYKQHITILTTLIKADTDFNSFISTIDDFLFELLNESLKNIRYKLNNEAKLNAVGLLTELQTNISQIGGFEDTTELSDAISRGKTDIQRAFDRVIEWFRVSEPHKDKPFTIDEALTISEKTIKVSNRNFVIDKDIDESVLDFKISGNLTVFVDMLLLIYGNVIKHSRVSSYPNAIIKIILKDNFLNIHVDNDIGKDVYNERNLRNVKELKSNVVGRGYGEAIKKEGGSGFHKLFKIINHDFKLISSGEKGTLDFGYLNEKKFFVKVGIPVLFYEA